MIAQHLLLSCLRPLLLAGTHTALHRESEHFIVTLKADILPTVWRGLEWNINNWWKDLTLSIVLMLLHGHKLEQRYCGVSAPHHPPPSPPALSWSQWTILICLSVESSRLEWPHNVWTAHFANNDCSYFGLSNSWPIVLFSLGMEIKCQLSLYNIEKKPQNIPEWTQ